MGGVYERVYSVGELCGGWDPSAKSGNSKSSKSTNVWMYYT
jgi:hypothetical protein